MAVDPLLAPLLQTQTAAASSAPPVPEARADANERSRLLIAEWYRPGPVPATVTERAISVDGGEIALRVYRPHGDGPFPLHLYIHGGGFWLGTLDSADIPSRELCVGAGAVVVSVDYRLAPEHRFPTGPEDCYTALCWVAGHAEELDGDASRLSVGGESAGGNLAAVVALMARDRGGPPITLQILGIPVTDLTMSQPSVDALGEGYLLTKAGMRQYREHYLNDPGEATHPYASPLLASDLTGLPPALVMTMEFDPLRDEGEAFARRLAEAGVRVRHRRWSGHIHGSALFTKVLPSASAYHRLLVSSLLSVPASVEVIGA